MTTRFRLSCDLSRVLWAVSVAVLTTACGGSTVTDTLVPGPPPVDSTRPPTTVQRASLTVTVRIGGRQCAGGASVGCGAG